MGVIQDEAFSTLQAVAEFSQSSFGERFLAGYAMGSLARGGFSPLVSDVDFGLILAGGLTRTDEQTVADIAASARACQWPLAERLSIFWSSREQLQGACTGGRFPPFDRLDLLDHGVLLAGTECRVGMVRPTTAMLEIDGLEFALDYLATPTRVAEFLDPAQIVDKGPLYLSKTVLFPARFLYTSQTGLVAGNDNASAYYVSHFEGPDTELVADTYDWRSRNMAPTDANQLVESLESGLLPLYENFLTHYQQRMQTLGRLDLSERALGWGRSLELQCFAP